MYNAVIRALQRIGLADTYGETEVPLYVLNAVYPLVDDEFLSLLRGQGRRPRRRGGPAQLHRAGVCRDAAQGRPRHQAGRQGIPADGRRIYRPGRCSTGSAPSCAPRRRCCFPPRSARRTKQGQVERDRAALLADEQASKREAESANRAKDVFLATLSHEMRTPLNAIVGWLSILRNEHAETGHFQEGLNVIERNTRAQVQLIDDLLDVSRIVSGKLRVNIEPCELTDVINVAVNVMRPAAEARGITLHVQLSPSASVAWCDSVRIQQVVWNLVSNAVKFTPKGGRVDVTLSREKSSFQIQVKDNGQGISSDLLPRVFDRFRQADSSTRRRFAGLGLGLSIVKYIVEAHGGTIEADSPGEGKGSAFTVRLPIRAVRIGEEGEEGKVAINTGEGEPEGVASVAPIVPRLPLVRIDGLRVLVVDDEADARRVLVLVLEQVGAIVTAAGSVREAIEALPKARPDVLVSDLGMPGQDGFDLIRQVRDEGHDARDLPAVALTAFVQKDEAHLALLAGFQVHVPKPVDPHDLTSVIARLAGRRD